MQYLLMIYENESNQAARTPQDQGQIMQAYMGFTQSIIQSGNFKAGDALHPTATATSVRVKNGDIITTDGPFAETTEQLGGYYLVEAKDLDEAIAIAARIPTATHGTIEIRPVMVFDNPTM